MAPARRIQERLPRLRARLGVAFRFDLIAEKRHPLSIRRVCRQCSAPQPGTNKQYLSSSGRRVPSLTVIKNRQAPIEKGAERTLQVTHHASELALVEFAIS